MDIDEFKEEWEKGPKEWSIDGEILEEPVGDCHGAGNHELEEEKQVNNDIEESQLANPQYKLNQRNEEFSRGKSGNYRARNAMGAKAIPKGELIAGIGVPRGK